jgi:hypothetical protein
MADELVPRRGQRWLGVALVAVGLGLLVVQTVGLPVWSFAWTLLIILPGLACFAVMLALGRAAGALAVPGSLLTTIGLILLYQALTNLWQSWAYLWTLLVAAVGLGLVIWGRWGARPELVTIGRRLAVGGLVAMLVGAVFFETVINISGLGGSAIARFVGPALLIAAGLALLAWPRRRAETSSMGRGRG